MRTPQLTEPLNFDWLPHALIAAGVLLSGVMVAEVVMIALAPGGFTITETVNFLATLPFIAILLGGGYWLRQSALQTDRYPRIATWTVAGFVFLTGFFTVIAVFTQEGLLTRIGIVRWAAAAGAGSGALVGIYEARAIDRAIGAERTRIRNEELKRQNDRLEEFAGILSHDLRNPLNVAEGYTDLLREEYDDESLEKIAAAHDRMDQIIEETLILARSGQVIDEPQAVSLAELVDQCWANVETREATVELEDTATIVADPDRLQHLFENLFRNAVEHGGTDVTIQIGLLSDDNGFYVEDNGPGIDTDDREEVLESGYSTKEGGTGFGLAIVSQIADAHGWNTHITEGEDGGARFEFTGVAVESTQESDIPSPTAATGSV